MDCSRSSSASIGSGAFWESLRGVAFFVDLGLGEMAVLGFEAALDSEPLRPFAGVPALEPSLGGALLTAGDDIVTSWTFLGVAVGLFFVDGNLGVQSDSWIGVLIVSLGREVYFVMALTRDTIQ